jgi:hypothetical protein
MKVSGNRDIQFRVSDRDLNYEVGLDFGPSLRCGKEEGNE